MEGEVVEELSSVIPYSVSLITASSQSTTARLITSGKILLRDKKKEMFADDC